MIYKVTPVILSNQNSYIVDKPERYLGHMTKCFLRTNCLLLIPHDDYLLVSMNDQFSIGDPKIFWGIYKKQFNKLPVEERKGEELIPDEITFELTQTTLTNEEIGVFLPYTVEVG